MINKATRTDENTNRIQSSRHNIKHWKTNI